MIGSFRAQKSSYVRSYEEAHLKTL